LECIQFYKERSAGEEGQLLEHCRKYAIEISKRVAEAAKFCRKTTREILGDQAQRPNTRNFIPSNTTSVYYLLYSGEQF
jgi:hypothetical protein